MPRNTNNILLLQSQLRSEVKRGLILKLNDKFLNNYRIIVIICSSHGRKSNIKDLLLKYIFVT